jgi:hypothetical protein
MPLYKGENMKRIKIYYVLRLLLSGLFGIAVGAGILWADAYAVEVFDVLLIAFGVIIALFNLPVLVLSLRAVAGKEKWEWINLVLAIVSIGFGACFALISRTSPTLPYVLMAYIVIVPIARVALVAEHLKQLRREIPKVLFGIFLLVVSATRSEDTMFLVLGIAVIAISALYMVKGFLEMPFLCRPYEERFEK